MDAWLALAALGALHGLHPASGWPLAGLWTASGRRPWQALAWLAAGHALSLAMAAALVTAALRLGLSPEDLGTPAIAVVWVMGLVAVVAMPHARPCAAPAALGLGAFTTATLHGAGWMLVPALTPLCLSGTPGREFTAGGSLVLALLAAGVHLGAMLAVAGVLAVVTAGPLSRCIHAWRRLWHANHSTAGGPPAGAAGPDRF